LVKYPDFLRHIVNPKLAEYLKKRRSLLSAVDEIRRFIVEAEVKYGFSVFNGNPENLKNYLQSKDFTLLISLFKTSNSLDILEEILSEVLDKYSDLPGVADAVKETLEAVRASRTKAEEGEGEA